MIVYIHGVTSAWPNPAISAAQRDTIERAAAAEHAWVAALGTDDPLDPKRRARTDATWPELVGQPDAIADTLSSAQPSIADTAAALVAHRPRRLLLVGAGDSIAVMMAARWSLELALGVPCEPTQSMDAAFFHSGLLCPEDAVVVLSSSGETTRSVEAMFVAQQAGCFTVALTNSPDSTLGRTAERCIMLKATRVGWPTQSSTAALAALYSLAAEIGRLTGRATSMTAELDHAIDAMARTIDHTSTAVAEIVADYVDSPIHLFAGAGPDEASAIIASAKVKECSPAHALAIQLEEYHHYNSQKPGNPLMVFVGNDAVIARALDTVHEAHRFGGTAHVVTTLDPATFADADTVLALPQVAAIFSPLATIIPGQLYGYHLAQGMFASADARQGKA
jgi:glutamine---fructose-6-phosphate transaminase (isomerizing)